MYSIINYMMYVTVNNMYSRLQCNLYVAKKVEQTLMLSKEYTILILINCI